ncbi:MAG: phosphoenolpyruvate--protein phosphotransferase [Acidobacteria bacterium SCN 69-37]|nr:MAG: phosphoenolpyruvate--protein phosphotransferase [Acidobacteria bacterium SCN 69-37]
MSRHLYFTCPLSAGLHARPASRLVEIASGFTAICSLINTRSGARADAKSVLAILAADVGAGDACDLEVCGSDEAAARAALETFLRAELPGYEEASPSIPAETSTLPCGLERSGARWSRGLAVSPGVGLGRVVLVAAAPWIRDQADLAASSPPDLAAEHQKLARAIHAVRGRLEARLAERPPSAEAAILMAHEAMVTDPWLSAAIGEAIDGGQSAAAAIVGAADRFSASMALARTRALRERVADVQGICRQLLDDVCGLSGDERIPNLVGPSVIVAETMTPQQLLGLDRTRIVGIVLESAGTTSHTVILARSLGIPTIVGAARARDVLPAGLDVVVDGHRGVIVSDLTVAAREFYARELTRLRARAAVLARAAVDPVTTADGRPFEVGANVSSIEELDAVRQGGADGIGLFRTELLFLRASELPSEEAQFAIYGEAVRAMQGRPVIVRTLDLGGDKPVAAVPMPQEANPFLGYRGVRAYVEHQQLIRTQLRAIVRASALGPIELLLPMVSSIEEVLWVKAQIAHVQDDLATRGVPFDRDMPIGIMLEVPAVSFVLDRLCREVDFFSIGTNDLCQYFFAADRGNTRVAPLANVTHPGFLRFLKQIVDEIRTHGRWVGLCGEMAGDVRLLPLLIGLGLDEISAAGLRIPVLKARIARLSAVECVDLFARATQCQSSDEVDALLDGTRTIDPPRPLVEPEIVRLDGTCASREEAIRTLVDALYVAGRTEDPCALEEAVWRREEAYATTVGDGIAVPHCRTDAVTSDSVGILKLREPVPWGGDGTPVQMVFLLAIRETSPSRAHMRVFSRLARMLIDADFREDLLRAADPASVIDQLSAELQVV